MKISEYLKLHIPDYSDFADLADLVNNFEILEKRAPNWTDYSNSGTVLERTNDFQIATTFPVRGSDNIFAVTVKMPRAYAEGDTITVDDIAYNLYQGTDPALPDAWKVGEVVTINFDKASRRCWASAGGGAPRPLPAQVSNMQASTPDTETPTIIFTWTNPTDENFAGMILVVKEGSAPNSVADGKQVYKGSATSYTYTEGVQFEHTYYCRGFAYNTQNQYQLDATGAIASATPSNLPDVVTDLNVTGNKGTATLTWKNPSQTSLHTVKVVQKINSAPESLTDGQEIYSGTGTTAQVSELQENIKYFWSVFTLNDTGKYKTYKSTSYTNVFPAKPSNYSKITDLIDAGSYTFPEDGWYLITAVGAGGLGMYGTYSGPDVGSGGYDGKDKATGGGGGGAGGFAETVVKKYKGDTVSYTVAVDSVRCLSMVATPGQPATGRSGGSGGTASGGTERNVNGQGGGSGGYQSNPTGRGATAAGGAGGRNDYSYGGAGGGASGTGNSGRGGPGGSGSSPYIRISRGNTNIPEIPSAETFSLSTQNIEKKTSALNKKTNDLAQKAAAIEEDIGDTKKNINNLREKQLEQDEANISLDYRLLLLEQSGGENI